MKPFIFAATTILIVISLCLLFKKQEVKPTPYHYSVSIMYRTHSNQVGQASLIFESATPITNYSFEPLIVEQIKKTDTNINSVVIVGMGRL